MRASREGNLEYNVTMKRIYSLLFVCITMVMLGLTACSETETEDEEFVNWQQRNAEHFAVELMRATEQVMLARQSYGDNWAEHTPWRSFRTYKLASAPTAEHEDSIAVEIIKRGSGRIKVMFSDSVNIRYRGTLIPTTKYPNGTIFSHSGLYEERERVFDARYAGTTGFRVQSLTEGVATALMQMVEGDRWRVCVPAKLAYANLRAGTIPAYSTLVFEIEVVSIFNTSIRTQNEK